MQWFGEQGFVYSLTPQLLSNDNVDDFLFGSRDGFCEHYSSAFVVLMRAAGIPARVVTGYQGGEFNPLSGHLVVRQRDAHAWAEVWLAGRGWTRVDPTAAVSPTRIDEGIDAAIPPKLGPDLLQFSPPAKIADTLRQIRQAMDAVQTRWNAWVLGYGASQQRQFLRELGLDAGYGSMVIALTTLLGVSLAGLAVWLLRKRDARDPLRAAYDSFCSKLARQGLARQAHEGPQDYAGRICATRPELSASVQQITGTYIALRYSEHGDTLDQFKREVAAFHP